MDGGDNIKRQGPDEVQIAKVTCKRHAGMINSASIC
jgi:hypothetical protein